MRCRFRRIRCRSGIGFRRKGAINVVDERIPESVRPVELNLDCKDGVVFVLTYCTWDIDHRLRPSGTRMDPVYHSLLVFPLFLPIPARMTVTPHITNSLTFSSSGCSVYCWTANCRVPRYPDRIPGVLGRCAGLYPRDQDRAYSRLHKKVQVKISRNFVCE